MRALEREERRDRRRLRRAQHDAAIAQRIASMQAEATQRAVAHAAARVRAAELARVDRARVRALRVAAKRLRARTIDINRAIDLRRERAAALLEQRRTIVARLQHLIGTN